MKPNYKAGLVLESREEQLQALITLQTSLVDIGEDLSTKENDTSPINGLANIVSTAVDEDKRRLHLDASQTDVLYQAVDRALEKFNYSRGVIGYYCLLNSIPPDQALEHMSVSDEPLLKRTAMVAKAGSIVLEFSGLLTILGN